MRKLIKTVKLLVPAMLFSVLISTPVSAHVVVRPGEVPTASYTTFTVSVPNEKDMATVGLRLLIPEGLASVMPTVKPGWNIEIEQTETENTDTHSSTGVTAISWTGGSIPVGQRDEFTFSAKSPEDAGQLTWKAYQTYEDGVVVAWDKSEADQPKKADGSPDFSTDGPFSVTVVTEDENVANDTTQNVSADKNSERAFYVSIAAVVVAFIALILATRSKK